MRIIVSLVLCVFMAGSFSLLAQSTDDQVQPKSADQTVQTSTKERCSEVKQKISMMKGKKMDSSGLMDSSPN